MQAAVFPKGARVRPRLCHAVAAACGDDEPAATDAAGSADRTAALRLAGA
ncbi:hypothetical protein ACRAWF_01880 [Streptomyces sp. L7]